MIPFQWIFKRLLALGICLLCVDVEGGLFPWQSSDWLDEWSSGGIISQPVGAGDDVGRAAVYQSDGKLIVVGRTFDGTTNDFLAIRYHADGSLDTSFDSDGIVTVSFTDGDAYAHAVALQSDGRIILAGRAWNSLDYDFGVARLHTDGALDTSFAGGTAIYDFTGGDIARGVQIDSQGRIVLGGYSSFPGNFDFAVARLSTNGVLDNAFDGDGLVTTAIGTASDLGYAVALQSDDKIILVGRSDVAATPRFGIARYNTDGSLDSTFSGDGIDAWALGSVDDVAWDVAIAEDNRIHLAGRSNSGANYRMALATYDTGGTRMGSQVIAIAGGAVARGIHIDGTKKILGGRAYNGANWDFAVVRLNSSSGNFGLDTTFNTNGTVITTLGTTDEMAYDLALQSDNKVVVAGTVYGSNADFGIIRLTTGGSLDTSFSTDGRVTTAVSGNDDVAYAVALQTDGKAVAAGFSFDGTHNDFALVRYNLDGSLDNTFDTDGIVTTSIGTGNAVANSIVIHSNGSIYAAGTSGGSGGDFTIARYLAGGGLDTAFDTDGIVTVDFNGSDDAAHAIALDSNGKPIVAGYAVNGGSRNFGIVRLNTNGSLDTSFDTDGRQVVSFITSSDDIAYGLALQPDGDIVLAGQSHNGVRTDMAIARLTANGSLDASFDSDGMLTTSIDPTNGSQVHAVAIQTDGKIVVAGRTLQIENRTILARYSPSGALDTSFNGSGQLVLSFSSGDDAAYALGLGPNGEIIGAGHSVSGTFDFLTFKVSDTGGTENVLDATFSSDGIATTTVGAAEDTGLGLAYAGGKIAIPGRTSNGANLDVGVARFNGDGTLAGSGDLDANFSTDGRVTTDIGDHDLAHSVALQSDDKIVVAGKSYNGTDDDFAVVRYKTDGSLDTSFSTDGIVTTAVGASDESAFAVALDSNQRVVAGGFTVSGANKLFALVRYATNGALDNTFDSDGRVTTSFAGSSDDVINALVIQPDNKVIAGGRSHNSTAMGFALARYNVNGSLDNSFDTDGLVVTEIDTAAGSELHGLALQSDGKIVAVGRTMGRDNQFAVVRYETNGSLDTSFSGDGLAVSSLTGGDDIAYDVWLDGDKIVVSGTGNTGSTYDMLIAKYNADGSLDTSFSGDGIATAAINTNDEFGYSIVGQANGKLLTAGFTMGSGLDFGLIRFLVNGSVDTSFGSSGSQTSDIGGANDVAQDAAITKDGRIVVVGYSNSGAEYDFAVARYWP